MRHYLIIGLIGLSLFGVSCKKKGCPDPNAVNYDAAAEKDDGSCTYPTVYSSEFTFNHELAGSSFLFDTLLYTHPAGQTYSVQTLKYFISDIILYKTGGDSVVLDITHYVDAQNTSTSILDYAHSIDDGTYTGLAFTFGLDETKNITGAFVNPPENLMEWPVPMGGGYHYMKFEGKYDSLGTIKNYAVHTGASQGNPYHFKVNLSQPFTVSNNELHAEFIMDVNNWLQNPILFDFDVFGGAIMGNQSAQQSIHDNGFDVFSIGTIY